MISSINFHRVEKVKIDWLEKDNTQFVNFALDEDNEITLFFKKPKHLDQFMSDMKIAVFAYYYEKEQEK